MIALDLMDTVIRDPYRQALESTTGLTLEQLAPLRDPTAWPRFELDELDEPGYAAAYFLPGVARRLDGERLRAAMFAGYSFVDGMELLLPQLASRWPLHLVSNYNRPWYEEIERRFRLSRWIGADHPSFVLGARKPEPLYYQRVLQRIVVRPGEILFVDDRELNVAAARAAGMQALRFQGADELRNHLWGER